MRERNEAKGGEEGLNVGISIGLESRNLAVSVDGGVVEILAYDWLQVLHVSIDKCNPASPCAGVELPTPPLSF